MQVNDWEKRASLDQTVLSLTTSARVSHNSTGNDLGSNLMGTAPTHLPNLSMQEIEEEIIEMLEIEEEVVHMNLSESFGISVREMNIAFSSEKENRLGIED